jgi:hypothetical protein
LFSFICAFPNFERAKITDYDHKIEDLQADLDGVEDKLKDRRNKTNTLLQRKKELDRAMNQGRERKKSTPITTTIRSLPITFPSCSSWCAKSCVCA